MQTQDMQLTIPASRLSDDGIEVALNPHPKAPFLLIVDQSASMAPWIRELEDAVKMVLRTVMVDDELASLRADLAILKCGGDVATLLNFGQAKPGEIPALPAFRAEGETPLGAAVRQGIAMLNARHADYRRNSLPSYRPHVFILSDGRPTDAGWENAAEELRALASERKWNVTAFGVGEAADLGALQKFSVNPVTRVDPSQIKALLRWVSTSIKAVSRSQNAGSGLPPVLPAFPQL